MASRQLVAPATTGFAHVLGAAAGAWLVVAVVAFVVEVDSNDPTAPACASRSGSRSPRSLPASRARARSGLPASPRSSCPSRSSGSSRSSATATRRRDDLRLVYLLTFASYLLLYLVSWTKGRAILPGGRALVPRELDPVRSRREREQQPSFPFQTDRQFAPFVGRPAGRSSPTGPPTPRTRRPRRHS